MFTLMCQSENIRAYSCISEKENTTVGMKKKRKKKEEGRKKESLRKRRLGHAGRVYNADGGGREGKKRWECAAGLTSRKESDMCREHRRHS